MEDTLQHFGGLFHTGRFQHFDRHDERVLEEVLVDHRMANDHRAVVGGRRKQGVLSVERDTANGSLVVTQRLVRSSR